MSFDRLTEYLDRLPAEGVPGCDLEVWIDHAPVYRHFTGERAPGVRMNGAETYWLYSATKPLTVTLAMQCVEDGALRLSDPVAEYLPAFAHLNVMDSGRLRPARTVMTIEHLMAMQGGLDYDIGDAAKALIASTRAAATTSQVAEAVAQKPLHFDPGAGFRYSLCIDVLGAVLETITGRSLEALARTRVFDPLGIRDLTFRPNAEQLGRLAALWSVETGTLQRQPDGLIDVAQMPYCLSGGGGLMGDVDGYIRLADALANGGVGANGTRILTRNAIDDMRRNRQSGKAMEDFKKVRHKRGYGYGLGVRTLIDPAASRSPVGEFGWDGAAGAWVMMDADHRIAAFYAQHVLACNRAYYEFHPAIRDLIYEAL